MASFDARLRLLGRPGLPLGVEVDLTGDRLRVSTGENPLANWSLDEVHIRTLHLMEELPSIDRKTLDELPLSFGKDRVKGQAAFSRATRSCQHYQLISGDIEADILEVMNTRPADTNQGIVLLSFGTFIWCFDRARKEVTSTSPVRASDRNTRPLPSG